MDSTSNKQEALDFLDNSKRAKQTTEAYSPSGRFFEEGTALNRIVSEAPYLARCSDNKTATLTRPRDYAIRYPYMQINRRGMVSWLIFDLDHSNSLVWDDQGLPPPNLIVRNRNNGHSHLYYAIPPVCTTENARDKPIQYMKAVYAAFATQLDADPDYNSGPVAKTPGHPWWSTQELHAHVYDLGELADYVELHVKPWRTAPKLEDVAHSRHCILFEQLRYYAYSMVNREREKGGTLGTFTDLLEAFANNHNTFARNGFSQNLLLSSLRATVKSVARWTWTKYRGDTSCCRGAMALDRSLPLAERQSLAAKRTHQLRHNATEPAIRAACQGLLQRGESLTHSAVSGLAKVSRRTVARYRHIIDEVVNAVTDAAVSVSNGAVPCLVPRAGEIRHSSLKRPGLLSVPDARDNTNVKPPAPPRMESVPSHVQGVPYGVHQITGPLGSAFDLVFKDSANEDSS